MAGVPPSSNLDNYQVVVYRRFRDSDLWYGRLVGYPEVNAFHRTWGGLRFALIRALDEYTKMTELINKKAESEATV